MKEQIFEYEKPEIEIVQFLTIDVICTSDGDNTEPDPFDPWG